MWKKILSLLDSVLRLSQELERNRVEIKEIRKDLLELTLLIQRVSHQVNLNSQQETSEREKLALQIENQLLRFDRRTVAFDSDGPKTAKDVTKEGGIQVPTLKSP